MTELTEEQKEMCEDSELSNPEMLELGYKVDCEASNRTGYVVWVDATKEEANG